MRRKKKKTKKSNKEFLVIMYVPGSVSVYDDLFCLFSGM